MRTVGYNEEDGVEERIDASVGVALAGHWMEQGREVRLPNDDGVNDD